VAEFATGGICPPGIPLAQGSFHATPLSDGNVNTTWPTTPAPLGIETVTLYGQYGNTEWGRTDEAYTHYNDGLTQAGLIKPLDINGNFDPTNGAIVFLFIGFSNCDIEVCGGNKNVWQADGGGLVGQPCATNCPNPYNHNVGIPYNRINGEADQHSFLYQIYHPTPYLVGGHVYVFDGALGGQTLPTWDPAGFYTDPNNLCTFLPGSPYDPECNYDRVNQDLVHNGFSEKQVQAIFIKTSTSRPQCDLSGLHCNSSTPDVYVSEGYMGNIVRYLKCCKAGPPGSLQPRYPNLHQVFITSRIYGGYAKNAQPGYGGETAGCLSPEPFAYEEGFAVQRLIVAQIKQTNNISSSDLYSGIVDYNNAPWIDWGPYLWASGNVPRSDLLYWCNNNGGLCASVRDTRYGDLLKPNQYWGDFTHPSTKGAEKVANELVKFIQGQLPAPQTHISDWVTPWLIW
jgi:hypothetical protein